MLHFAAKGKAKWMAELLLSKGVNINVKAILYLNLKILYQMKIRLNK